MLAWQLPLTRRLADGGVVAHAVELRAVHLLHAAAHLAALAHAQAAVCLEHLLQRGV
jgi:hypothetical protein